MTTKFNYMTDEQLLEEIKRQWYEKSVWDYQLMQLTEEEAFTPANDYLSSDIEEHITRLEQEYKRRGFELPDRYEYVNQFLPEPEEDGIQTTRACFNCETGVMTHSYHPDHKEPGWYCMACDTFLPDDQEKERPGL